MLQPPRAQCPAQVQLHEGIYASTVDPSMQEHKFNRMLSKPCSGDAGGTFCAPPRDFGCHPRKQVNFKASQAPGYAVAWWW